MERNIINFLQEASTTRAARTRIRKRIMESNNSFTYDTVIKVINNRFKLIVKYIFNIFETTKSFDQKTDQRTKVGIKCL